MSEMKQISVIRHMAKNLRFILAAYGHKVKMHTCLDIICELEGCNGLEHYKKCLKELKDKK